MANRCTSILDLGYRRLVLRHSAEEAQLRLWRSSVVGSHR